MITTKKHNKIVSDLNLEIETLKSELKQAKSLKDLLDELVGEVINPKRHNILTSTYGGIGITEISGGYDLKLGDDVLVYVEDILGGKVIKQEGTKCLVIDKDGSVNIGLTKDKADEGFSYKLVRK